MTERHRYVVTIKKDGNKQTINAETLKNAAQREVTIADGLVHLGRFHIAFFFGYSFREVYREVYMIEKLRFATLVGLIIFLSLLRSLIFTRDQENKKI